MKFCSSCKRTLAIDKFYSRSDRPTTRCYCTLCSRISKYFKYGLTFADFRGLYVKQGESCAVCSTPTTIEKLHVDHDHITKKVRGLLCDGCNSTIAFFKESPQLIARAKWYLSQSTITIECTPVNRVKTDRDGGIICGSCDIWKPAADFRANTRKCTRCSGLWSNYRLRGRDYQKLVDAQNKQCRICSSEPTTLYVDHDHVCCTGTTTCGTCIRGLLCNLCNLGLGKCGDNPIVLDGCLRYLAEYGILYVYVGGQPPTTTI